MYVDSAPGQCLSSRLFNLALRSHLRAPGQLAGLVAASAVRAGVKALLTLEYFRPSARRDVGGCIGSIG